MEKQQPQSEDATEGIRTTVLYPSVAELEKEGGGACCSAQRNLAPAQWNSSLARPSGLANPSPDVEVEGAEGKLREPAGKPPPVCDVAQLPTPRQRRLPEAFPLQLGNPR